MLAIIIPYYKHTFFDTTLRSLAQQSCQDFKVYIGDDASPEDPRVLLNKFKGKFDFVYHKFENNLGEISLVKQWDRCIALSGDEEWIMILGDDDVLGENVVEAFCKNLEEIKSVSSVVRMASCKIDGKGTLVSSVYLHPKLESSVEFFFRGVRSSLSEYVFNKEKLLTIGFKNFPLAWLSDVLAVLEFSNFQNVYSINEATVYVRTSNLNISGRQDNLKQKGKAYFCFYFYLLEQKHNYFSETQKKELLFRISRSFLNHKKKVGIFFKISKIYLNNFLVADYFRFLKSIVITIFHKECE
jgi:glycosyltransferase involved in cell wall biosynthesis